MGNDTLFMPRRVVSHPKVISNAHGATKLLGLQIPTTIHASNYRNPIFNYRGSYVGINNYIPITFH